MRKNIKTFYSVLQILVTNTYAAMRTYGNKKRYLASFTYMTKFYEYSCKKHEQWEAKNILHERSCPICHSNNSIQVLSKDEIDCCKYNKCGMCGFVFQSPVPPESEYYQIYVTGFGGLDKWWSEHKKMHRARINYSPKYFSFLPDILLYKRNGAFLDFGCGTGKLLDSIKDKYDIYGIDIDEDRIRKARALLKDDQGKVIMNYFDLDQSVFISKFDIIHVEQNIEHLLDPMDYMRKFYSWLKPGGAIYLSCPASDSFAFSFLGKYNSMASLGHVSLFNKKSLHSTLDKLGFIEIKIKHYNLDVNAFEIWKTIFNSSFIHRHSYITNDIFFYILYPIMFITTLFLFILEQFELANGNYISAFAKKPL